jgi:predicted RNase H-like HicB family nuclease
MNPPKTIDYYLALAYPIVLIPEEAGVWFAKIPLLPGCMTEGDSPAHALEMVEDAKRGWIESALKHDEDIPEPQPGIIEIVYKPYPQAHTPAI